MGTNSCVPFRGRGPRSGEGVLEGKNRKDTLKWSRPPIGGPENSGVSHRCLASYTLWPLKGQRGWAARNLCVILFLYHSGGSPLWWLAPPPLPLFRGHYGCWTFRSICAWSSSERKTIQPGFARGKCTPSAACGGVSPEGGDLLYNLHIVS